jgi:hypothetical protein
MSLTYTKNDARFDSKGYSRMMDDMRAGKRGERLGALGERFAAPSASGRDPAGRLPLHLGRVRAVAQRRVDIR